MSAILRLADSLICLLFIGWTMVFPLATLLSLLMTLRLLAVLLRRPAPTRDHRHIRALRA